MKTWISILAGAMTLCALPVNAATRTPDYVAFTRKINEISAFLASGMACRAAGYTVVPDEEAVNSTIAPTLAQAIKDGIPESMAYGMMDKAVNAAVEAELADMKGRRAKAEALIENDEALMAAVRDFYESIDVRCQGYTRSAQFSALISAPQSDGYTHFLKWIVENL